jgi:hypothetical protein
VIIDKILIPLDSSGKSFGFPQKPTFWGKNFWASQWFAI